MALPCEWPHPTLGTPCRGLGAEVAESEQMLEDVRRTHDVPWPFWGGEFSDPR